MPYYARSPKDASMLMLLNSTCKTRSIQHGRLKMEKHYTHSRFLRQKRTTCVSLLVVPVNKIWASKFTGIMLKHFRVSLILGSPYCLGPTVKYVYNANPHQFVVIRMENFNAFKTRSFIHSFICFKNTSSIEWAKLNGTNFHFCL